MTESIFDLLNNVKQEDTTDPNSRVLIIDGLVKVVLKDVEKFHLTIS